MNKQKIVDLFIKSRGRKYFSCGNLGEIKLIIDSVTSNLQAGQVVRMVVQDFSEYNPRWGWKIKYEARKIISINDEKIIEQLARKQAENQLCAAEQHASKGNFTANMFALAIDLAADFDHLTERLNALKVALETNRRASEKGPLKFAPELCKTQADVMQRHLFTPDQAPSLNVPIRYRKRFIVYHSRSNSVKIYDYSSDIYGEHLRDHVGEWGNYYYWRAAEKTEIAKSEA